MLPVDHSGVRSCNRLLSIMLTDTNKYVVCYNLLNVVTIRQIHTKCQFEPSAAKAIHVLYNMFENTGCLCEGAPFMVVTVWELFGI